MSEKTVKIFRYSLGLYFLIGGLVSLYIVLTTLGVLGFLQSLIPATITVIVIFLFILSGYKYAFSTSKSGVFMMKISLLIQAIQVVFLGLSFKNYFGPYLAVGFADTPDLKFQTLIEPLTSWFANGLNKFSDEVSLVFNLVAIILLILVYRVEFTEANHIAELNRIDIETE
jgi:hypothetical protein